MSERAAKVFIVGLLVLVFLGAFLCVLPGCASVRAPQEGDDAAAYEQNDLTVGVNLLGFNLITAVEWHNVWISKGGARAGLRAPGDAGPALPDVRLLVPPDGGPANN